MITSRSVALRGFGYGPHAIAVRGFYEVELPPPSFYGGLVYSPFRLVLRAPFRLATRW